MSRPWMPLYIADYLADTAHLSAAESGAYLHLIMHYWQNGSLPDDDVRLARIARMTPLEWSAARPIIVEFFGPDWSHNRIDGELAEAERLSKAGRKGGEASAEKRKRNPRPKGTDGDEPPQPDLSTQPEPSGNQTVNDPSTILQPPQPPPQKVGDGGARESLIRPLAHELAEDLAVIAGYPDIAGWPPSWCGAALHCEKWLAEDWKPEIILITARQVMGGKRDGPPSSVVFFEQAIARAHAKHAAPLPQVTVAQRPPETIHEAPRNASDWKGRRDRGHSALDQFSKALADAKDDQCGRTGGEVVQIGIVAGCG